MKIFVIYNEKSGQKSQLAAIKSAFSAHKIKVTYCAISPHIKKDVNNARKQGCKLIVAAGGDGTVSAVAAALVDTPLILGIIPIGTLNHFAKDLKIPTSIEGAIKILLHGTMQKIDVAMGNHHVFINNSSIGIYPALVRERQKHQAWLGKWPAALVALIKVMGKLRRYHIIIKANGKERRLRTPFIFIGNNSYHIRKFGFTNRSNIDKGVLSVYWITTKNLLRITHIFLRALTGRAYRDKDFDTVQASEVQLIFRRPRINIAFDGELKVVSTTPLCYKSKPLSLTVIK